MGLADAILYRLAKNWPAPMEALNRKLNARPGSDAYAMAYAQHQYDIKIRGGIQLEMEGLDVLEIGCGHGGVTCFIAMAAGARSVTGLDLNTQNLEYAKRFAKQMAERFGGRYELPVRFLEMNAEKMDFPPESFDLVIADNAFEHFSDPEAVMKESYRVLRPGGRLLVPIFSSIFSKYGLHLKHGLKMPWANLFFSEKTIIKAMHRMAKVNPEIRGQYPGLSDSPHHVRDLRPHKDLNGITFANFKAMAHRNGFSIRYFKPKPTISGMLIFKMPVLKETILMDILSTGASACLVKKATS